MGAGLSDVTMKGIIDKNSGRQLSLTREDIFSDGIQGF